MNNYPTTDYRTQSRGTILSWARMSETEKYLFCKLDAFTHGIFQMTFENTGMVLNVTGKEIQFYVKVLETLEFLANNPGEEVYVTGSDIPTNYNRFGAVVECGIYVKYLGADTGKRMQPQYKQYQNKQYIRNRKVN